MVSMFTSFVLLVGVFCVSYGEKSTIPHLSLKEFRSFVSDGDGVCIKHTFDDQSFGDLNPHSLLSSKDKEEEERRKRRELHPSQRRRTGTVHAFGSSSRVACERTGGEWTEVVDPTRWDRHLMDVEKDVSAYWEKHARRHLLETTPSKKSLYLVELNDDVTLTTEQYQDFRSILGDELKSMFRKKKGDTGDGMIQVYTSSDAIERLYETYASLIRTVSPFPAPLKVTAYLRATTATHVTQSPDVEFEVNMNVYVSSGAMEDSDVTIEDIATQFERLCEDEDPVDDVPYAFQAVGDRQVALTVTTTLAHVRDIADLLATDPRVSRVTLQPQYEIMNYHGTATLQVGADQTGQAAQDYPFHAAGITGKNQVVGVGDSGLDYGHCLFRDPNNLVTGPNGAPLQTGETYNNANARKVVQYVGYADAGEDEDAGHGTHVAGSVAGLATADGNCNCAEGESSMKGQAYDAKIALYDIGRPGERFLRIPPNVYTTLCQDAFDIGAKIHTNSWGSPSNVYGTSAFDFDQFSYDHQDFLVLVAAGNSGGPGTEFDGTVGSPATGKNILSVGAGTQDARYWSDTGQTGCNDCDDNDLAYFTSRGPAFDNRVKPEAIAPGMLIRSARSSPDGRDAESCAVVDFQGTSMATPLLAGTAALVRDYFESGFYPQGTSGGNDGIQPMGALVKAVLLNGAVDISDGHYCSGYNCAANNGADSTINAAPSNQQGFGRVNIGDALPFTKEKLFVVGFCPNDAACVKDPETGTWPSTMTTVTQGEEVTYEINVKSEATYFKTTLVWHGPVTDTSGNNLLINDLDLVVTAPDGETFLPLAKDGATPAVDQTNNVEQIVVGPFAAGSKSGVWTVKITGTSVSSSHSPQPFALALNTDFVLDDTTNNGGGSNSAATGLSAGAFSGAFVGIFFLVLGTGLVCWFIRGGPQLNAIFYAVLDLVMFALSLAATVLISSIERGDWRIQGTFAVCIVVIVVYFATFVLGCLRIFSVITVSEVQFSVLRAVVAGVFLALWVIFVPSFASSPVADSVTILLVFLLAAFCAVDLMLFFTSYNGKSSSSSSSSSSNTKRVPPSTRPKPRKQKKTPPALKPKPKTPKKKKTLAKGATVKAKWAYRSQRSDELALKKGDLVKVLSVQDDGWVYGTSQRTYKKGMFPGNYVVVV